MTYTELVAAIEAYTENYEQLFVDNIPVFVKQAEKRIYNTAQIPALRKNVTGLTAGSNKYGRRGRLYRMFSEQAYRRENYLD